mmetsp:Transcript_7952/g.13352  ORF Transcript_7952/g.13352 Transcript_7952/m.13352 type:complete len:106 (-) Transcript_7952:597-914(-)
MKLETYPNRDSLVFQERFGMKDCETFIRGTIRFSGFSWVIAAFHDLGLTSDDPIDEGCTNLRDFLNSKIKKISPLKDQAALLANEKVFLEEITNGMSSEDASIFL